MAIDDGAQFHERFGSTFKAIREDAGGSFDFFPSYTWQILFLPIFGAVGFFMFGFLWHELDAKSSRILLVTAIALQVLAVGMDFVEGLDDDHRWNLYTVIANRYDLEPWTEARFGETAFDTAPPFFKIDRGSHRDGGNGDLMVLVFEAPEPRGRRSQSAFRPGGRQLDGPLHTGPRQVQTQIDRAGIVCKRACRP